MACGRLFSEPSLWFLILGILLILALVIWASINKTFNSTFWTFTILGIVIVVWALIFLIIELVGSRRKEVRAPTASVSSILGGASNLNDQGVGYSSI